MFAAEKSRLSFGFVTKKVGTIYDWTGITLPFCHSVPLPGGPQAVGALAGSAAEPSEAGRLLHSSALQKRDIGCQKTVQGPRAARVGKDDVRVRVTVLLDASRNLARLARPTVASPAHPCSWLPDFLPSTLLLNRPITQPMQASDRPDQP